MKLNNTMVEGQGARDESQKKVRASTLDSRPSTARCGVALVITVILLAMVTLLAITFLGVTRRQRNAVTTTTDTATAQYAADDALAAAEAQIVANTLATTNPYNFGLLVSTNYINRNGYDPSGGPYHNGASPTNVNYDYQINGNPLTPDEFLQNLANLYYLPRAPVYMSNLVTHAMENRFYLDLNRNGVDDPNGWLPEIGPNGGFMHPDGTENNNTANVVTNFQMGDPDWVGILQHPDQPYGPNNPFVARYAFIAVPIGNALDLNHIFNQVLDEDATPIGNPGTIRINPSQRYGLGRDAFRRNQGVGSWEINLAAFLADLNTNEWGQIVGSGVNPPVGSTIWYQYNQGNPTPPGPSPNLGRAFGDARALLAYRYQNNYATLGSADSLFYPANDVFPYDNIDEYSDGPLQLTPAPIDEINNQDNPTLPWAGAPNTNQFFDPQELFDPDKANIGALLGGNSLTNHLLTAGRGNSTYDRYTYYRWLSQMGVDSAPEQDQINLNYSNAAAYFYPDGVVSNITYYPDAETNLTQWQPLQFFTIAADRMLRAYSQEWITESPSNYVATYCMTTNISTDPIIYPTNVPMPFGISDIPVLISNRFVYTPAIQRVLQLAANIYDATTNNATPIKPDYPSVFRPIFWVTNNPDSGYTDVYIKGYEPVGYDGRMGAVRPPIAGGTNNYQLTLPVRVTDLQNPSYQIPYYGYLPSSSRSGIYNNINVYGVPWIIGAKKGFPNFNEFAMESAFLLTRKLQVKRDSTNDTYVMNPDHYHFNQMFNLSLSNQLAVECWNSYTNFYQSPDGQPRSVTMYVDDALSVTLTNNDYPFTYTTNFLIATSRRIPHPGLTAWPGYNPIVYPLSTPDSFQLPMNVNVPVIPTSTYRFKGGSFGPYLTTNLDLPFEENVDINGNLYPQPHWWLITRNNVRAIILDTTDPSYPQVIDYVQLSGPDSVRDLSLEIMTNYDVPFNAIQASGSELWNTNLDQNGVPIGITSQIGVSDGNYTPTSASGTWDTTDPILQANEIAGFTKFMGYTPIPPLTAGEQNAIALAKTSLANQAPYSPVATVIQIADWQVNDPLVHYLAQDIYQPGIEPSFRPPIPPNPAPTLTNSAYATIGYLNTQYMPWGRVVNPNAPDFMTLNAYNLALKDPLVWRSDDWDFPAYKLPTVGWLGRVHRGTPWQTVYLKSPNILREVHVGVVPPYVGTNTWVQWTGDTLALTNREMNGLGLITNYSFNYFDAANTAPVQDRLLFDMFTTAPNANATRGQLSVNVDASNPSSQAGLAAWSALFSGVQVLSNTVPDGTVSLLQQHNGSLANFTAFPIDPAGPAGANSPVGQIVTGINQTRANVNKTTTVVFSGSGRTYEIPASFANPNGVGNAFEHVGDILAVPQLSVASPFLNTNLVQQDFGISDEMYDWLPQQVLSLLRVSGTPQSPMRYVIYCYGQALKPAPGGIYTGGGAYFGMVTNYQVVAESASRAVVNFGSVVTNVLTTNADNVWISVPVVTNNTVQLKGIQPLAPY